MRALDFNTRTQVTRLVGREWTVGVLGLVRPWERAEGSGSLGCCWLGLIFG